MIETRSKTFTYGSKRYSHPRNKCYETKFKIIKNIFNAVLYAQERKNEMKEREREGEEKRELERRADCKRWQK